MTEVAMRNALCTIAIVIIVGLVTACASSASEATVSGITVQRLGRTGYYKLVRNPSRGYHFNAYLWIPSEAIRVHRLLVTPNNTGTADDSLELHDTRAYRAFTGSWEGRIAEELGAPHLMPVFPRPRTDWQYYTHSLDSDTLKITSGALRRLDLQLLAMINDVREYLGEAHGIRLPGQVLLSGFSASGTFVNRFTVLHPDRVRAVACGGVNAIPILPVSSYEGTRLPYHIGIADLESITGREFDLAAWQRVSQYVYMGELDANDTTLYDDGFTRAEAALVWDTVGKDMSVRWANCIGVYLAHTERAQMVTYLGLEHNVVVQDMVEFLRVNADDGFSAITPSGPAVVAE
ncbi:MAG: hypothetical protein ACOC2Y_09915 [Spirochaetota bacterium]